MLEKRVKFLLTLGFILQVFISEACAQSGVVFTSLHSFAGGEEGAIPTAALVQGRDGNFYGTTFDGGTNYYGTVFKISENGMLTNLYSFSGSNDGVNPEAGLVQGNDGSFYGTTSLGGGGTNGGGTVFRISTNGAFTNLYCFPGGDEGSEPYAGLVQGSDGNFYSTTVEGGTNGDGTVFKISTNGTLTSLYSFTGGDDGSTPFAGLVQGSDGNFYGTTSAGGTNGYGTVFKISTNGTLTSLYSFAFGNDGYGPYVGLVQGSDGYFYGTTPNGGTNGCGTVFKISTNGTLTSLYSFPFGVDGAHPEAVLAQGTDGFFYGTTFRGGANGAGNVFKISTSGMLTSLYSFTGGSDGLYPNGLVQGNNGSFYGTTGSGGTNDMGTVFELTMTPQLTMAVSGAFVTLSWPTNYTRWYLQKAVNLGAAGFVRVTLQAPPVIANGQFVVTLPIIDPQAAYYRLSSE